MSGIDLKQGNLLMDAFGHEPGLFMTKALDVAPRHYWSKMREVEVSLDENERTSVKAGHGVSKTYTLARLVLKFLYLRCPSTVVTTAPTGHQVKDLLWREIRTAHSKAQVKLGGKLTTMQLDMQEESGLLWFATGFSCRPDTVTNEATAFQGYHNDNVLLVFDEAAAVLPEIWRASEHIGAPYKRWVVIGNPTSRVGDFAATFSDQSWHNITIAVKDTPNYKEGKTIIPGMYGLEYETRIREKYGINSDEYRVRVMGEISNKAALGAYYGAIIRKLREKGMVCHPEIRYDPSSPVHTVQDPGYTTAVWWFQRGPMGPRFLDYYEDSGTGAAEIAKVIFRKGKEKEYSYGSHFAAADVDNNAQRAASGKTVLQVSREMGLYLIPLQRERSVSEGIARTARFLETACFSTDCKHGVDLAEAYHERMNKRMSTEDKPVFTGVPEKDGTDHAADGLRYASMAYERIPGELITNDSHAEELSDMYRGIYA